MIQQQRQPTMNKGAWGRGPWLEEPDRLEWKTEAGLPALIIRQSHGGYLCGYVAVTDGHPCFGRDYMSSYEPGPDGEPDFERRLHNPVDDLDVHGGITYGNACRGSICHVPDPGESDNVWWLGFDCNHHGDKAPSYEVDSPWRSFRGGTYRDVEYVRAECEGLARQLVAMAAGT